jgi:hypothetical protein
VFKYVTQHLFVIVQAGSLVLLSFLTHLVHSLGFVKHAAPSAPSAGGAARAVASAVLVMGSAGASKTIGSRMVVPYAKKVLPTQWKAPAGKLFPQSLAVSGKVGMK